MITEAEKSHDLASASWTPREASSEIQSQAKGPRTRSSDVRGRAKMGVPAQAEKEFALPLPCCSIQALSERDKFSCIGEGRSLVLSLLIQMLTSFREAPTDTPRNHLSPPLWASDSSIKLTHRSSPHKIKYKY